jgi:RNA polymerase sigma-70 factor (ECF subfamily)
MGWKGTWDVVISRPGGAGPDGSTGDLAEADDRALVAAFVAGHREAFDVIVRRHQRAVYLICYRFVSSHEDAADLAQDVFVRAFKGLGGFKQESALGTVRGNASANC